MIEKLYLINLLVFVLGVILFFTLEHFFAFRKNTDTTFLRWRENFSLTFINTIIIRFFLIITPISVAVYATENSLGIFHILQISPIIAGILSFLILEIVVYGEHVLFHKVPFFWRFHSVHHSDRDMDFSTALRFHFVESIFSVVSKILVVLLLGAPVLAVLVFEIVLNFSAMFNHSNINLPEKVERILSKIIVTPKFHEIHHSQILRDSQSNYGFFLSIWDYVFSTYEFHHKKIQKLGLSGQKKRYGFKKLILGKLEDV